MAIPAKVTSLLKKAKVSFKEIQHKTVYTAYDAAQTMKAKLNEVVKTLVVKTEKGYVLAVLPANMRLDIQKLKKMLGVKKIEIAKEKVMKQVYMTFPPCPTCTP